MATQTTTTTIVADSSTAIPYPAIIRTSGQDFSSSSTICSSPLCPIDNPHNKSIYTPVSRNEIGPEAHRMFSPRVPPPHVLAAFERCLHECRTAVDMKMWFEYHERHIEPLIESPDLRWVAPVSAGHIDEYLDCVSDQTHLGSLPKTKGIVARHPFGPNNPPDGVWASYARLRLRRGGCQGQDRDLLEKDEEFVGAFSADSGYCAEGVGELVIDVRRFKVRRLSFVRQLARIRKQRR